MILFVFNHANLIIYDGDQITSELRFTDSEMMRKMQSTNLESEN